MIYEIVEKHTEDTKAAADKLIEEAENSMEYELKKHTCEVREKKSKGEVIDTWYRVTLTKVYGVERPAPFEE